MFCPLSPHSAGARSRFSFLVQIDIKQTLSCVLLGIENGRCVTSSLVGKNELQRRSERVFAINVATVLESERPSCSWLSAGCYFTKRVETFQGSSPRASASHPVLSPAGPFSFLPRVTLTPTGTSLSRISPLSYLFSLPVPFSLVGSTGQSPVSLKTIYG